LDPPLRPGLLPAALVPGPRRHWPRPVFAAGAVLLAAAVTAALALAGGGTGSPRVIAADSVGSLDLATGQIAAGAPGGSGAAPVAAGGGGRRVGDEGGGKMPGRAS